MARELMPEAHRKCQLSSRRSKCGIERFYGSVSRQTS